MKMPVVLMLLAASWVATSTGFAGDAPATATAPASQPAPLALSDADNGKTVTAPLGATITVSLQANATTGYSWSLGKIDGDAVTSVGEVQYTPDNTRGLVGSGGIATATFHAAKAGKATITLNYTRPWEKNTPPARTFSVTIDVKPAP